MIKNRPANEQPPIEQLHYFSNVALVLYGLTIAALLGFSGNIFASTDANLLDLKNMLLNYITAVVQCFFAATVLKSFSIFVPVSTIMITADRWEFRAVCFIMISQGIIFFIFGTLSQDFLSSLRNLYVVTKV